MFESPHWFRELAATLGIFATAIGISMLWLGFIGVPVGIALTILTIWLLRKRALRIRGQSSPPAGGDG